MERQSYDRMKMIAALMKIHHKELGNYIEDLLPVAKSDSELFAHLLAWNYKNSKVKNSKIVFSPIALRGCNKDTYEFAENAVAHMGLLNPRELRRSYQFSCNDLTAKGYTIPCGYRRLIEQMMEKYIRIREAHQEWWDKAVVSHRKAMLYLYLRGHIEPSKRAQDILFDKKYPKGSVFEAIKKMKKMSSLEAAGTIINYKIPLTVAVGAVSSIKDENILLAILENISGNELLNNTNMLERLGVFDVPHLKAAYDKAVERAKDDKKVNTFKAYKTSKVVNKKVVKKVVSIQRVQEQKLKGLDGNWLTLADCSTSMQKAIDYGKSIAYTIASQGKGDSHLIFFNEYPRYFNTKGKSFDQIEKETKHIRADGWTSIGCGLDYVLDKGFLINGIVIASDGGENEDPFFVTAYKKYVAKMGIEPTVYFLYIPGASSNVLSENCKGQVDIQEYVMGKDFDYYSLPNIISVLKPTKYGLLDEVMETPLLTLKDVFPN